MRKLALLALLLIGCGTSPDVSVTTNQNFNDGDPLVDDKINCEPCIEAVVNEDGEDKNILDAECLDSLGLEISDCGK